MNVAAEPVHNRNYYLHMKFYLQKCTCIRASRADSPCLSLKVLFTKEIIIFISVPRDQTDHASRLMMIVLRLLLHLHLLLLLLLPQQDFLRLAAAAMPYPYAVSEARTSVKRDVEIDLFRRKIDLLTLAYLSLALIQRLFRGSQKVFFSFSLVEFSLREPSAYPATLSRLSEGVL